MSLNDTLFFFFLKPLYLPNNFNLKLFKNEQKKTKKQQKKQQKKTKINHVIFFDNLFNINLLHSKYCNIII